MGRACSQNGRGEGRSAFKILTNKPIGNRPLGGLGVDGRKILEWILKKQVSIRGVGLIWLRIGIIGEPFECGSEPPCSISHGDSYLVNTLQSMPFLLSCK